MSKFRFAIGIVIISIFIIATSTFEQLRGYSGGAQADDYSEDSRVMKVDSAIAGLIPFSEDILHLKTDVLLSSGKSEFNDVFIVGDMLISSEKKASVTAVESNTDFVGNFDSANLLSTGDTRSKYLMLIPDTGEIYRDYMPIIQQSTITQREIINSVYETLANDTVGIDTLSVLSNVRDRYIYYRTEDMLTMLGGYYCYSAIGDRMSFEIVPRTTFNIEYAEDEYYGELSEITNYKGTTPDIISLYHSTDVISESTCYYESGQQITKDGIYFEEYLEDENKTDVILGDGMSIIDIKTNRNTQTQPANLLVFADDFGKTVVPFLVEHYDRITVIYDECSTETYTENIDESLYQKVLFLFSAQNFSTERIFTDLQFDS